MNYKNLIKQVAKEYHTSPDEVDSEIRAAIKAAGLDMEPAEFIAMVAMKVTQKIEEN